MVIKWLRSIFWTSRTLIGTDYLGNKYYETIKESGKALRSIEAGMKHEDYASGQVPHEWEAWVRGKREQPPTIEEIERRIKTTKTIQLRAQIKQKQDDENQERAYKEGLIAKERSSTASETKQKMAGKHTGSDIKQDEVNEPEAWKPPS